MLLIVSGILDPRDAVWSDKATFFSGYCQTIGTVVKLPYLTRNAWANCCGILGQLLRPFRPVAPEV